MACPATKGSVEGSAVMLPKSYFGDKNLVIFEGHTPVREGSELRGFGGDRLILHADPEMVALNI